MAPKFLQFRVFSFRFQNRHAGLAWTPSGNLIGVLILALNRQGTESYRTRCQKDGQWWRKKGDGNGG
jgi:hypothetical protein